MNVRVPFTEEQIAWIDARIKSGMSVYVRTDCLRDAPFSPREPRVLQPGDVVTSAEAQALPAVSLVRFKGAAYERCTRESAGVLWSHPWVSPPMSVVSSQRNYCETQPDGSRIERVGPEKPSYTVVDGEAEIVRLKALVASGVEIIEALRKDVEELRTGNRNLRECNRTAVSAETHRHVQHALTDAIADRKFLVEKVEDMRRIIESIGKVST